MMKQMNQVLVSEEFQRENRGKDSHHGELHIQVPAQL